MEIRSLVSRLTKIGEEIYSLYMSDNVDKAEKILKLLDIESSIYDFLDLKEADTRIAVMGMLLEKSDFIDSELPYGITKMMNQTDYAYYRIMARVKYYDNIPDNPSISSVKSLIDNQISYIYNDLLSREDEYLTRIAYLILMNAPDVEKTALKNKLEPFETIYDTLDFEVEFTELINIIKEKKSLDKAAVDFYNSAIEADDIRVSYFTEKLLCVMEQIKLEKLKSNFSDEDLDLVKILINSLVALLDIEDLEEMRIASNEIVANPDMLELVNESFDESEKIFELKTKVSMIN